MKRTYIILGILLGVISAGWPATVFVGLLLGISIWTMKKCIRSGSGGFLIMIFLIGFFLRVIFSFLNYTFAEYHGMGADTQPDARVYNSNALYIASVITGNKYSDATEKDAVLAREMESAKILNNRVLPRWGDYQIGFYVYIVGWLYALLGYAPVAAKILNGLAGCAIAIVTYFTARLLVKSEVTARFSAVVMMFLPSALYWSVTLLRDTPANLLFLSYSVLLLAYLKNSKMTYLVFSAVLAFLLSLFKVKIILFIVAGFVFVLFLKFVVWALKVKKVRVWIMLTPVILLLIIFLELNITAIYGFIRTNIDTMLNIQLSSSINPSATTYDIHGDILKAGNAGMLVSAAIVFKALAYYFLSPFPWYIPYGHGLLLMFYPQVIFTFLCIPFMILGIVVSLRRDPVLILAALGLLVLLIVPQALTESIIGNVVRHRDMFMPFIVIFSIYGFCLKFLPAEKSL